jgi:hypothetical protein
MLEIQLFHGAKFHELDDSIISRSMSKQLINQTMFIQDITLKDLNMNLSMILN